jgi:hypothetical protein
VGHPLTVGDSGPDQETTESNRYRPQSVPSTAGLAARVADNWHLLVLGGWTLIWFVILAPHGGISWTFFTTGSRLLFGTGQGALPHTSGLDLYASQFLVPRACAPSYHFGVHAARHGLQQDREPGSAVVHQVDAVAHAGASLPVRPAGEGSGHHAAHARRAERAAVSGLEEFADPDDLELAHEPDSGNAEDFMAAVAGVPGAGVPWAAVPRPAGQASRPTWTLTCSYDGQVADTVGTVAASGPRWSRSNRRSGSSCVRAASTARFSSRRASRPTSASSA